MFASRLGLIAVCLAVLSACNKPSREADTAPPAAESAKPAQPSASPSVSPEMKQAADKIIAAARQDEQGWARLTALCDRVGNRFTGTPGLEHAIDWALADWTKDGLDDVRREAVMVKRWKRGAESLLLMQPNGPRPLPMLGLGNSPGTGERGITAPVVVVADFDQLQKLGDAVRGKIVLFNFPMKTKDNMFEAYGDAVIYRWKGPVEASKAGARAALVRSVTTRSLRTPHTGSTKLIDPSEDKTSPIPAAAISIEDAEMFQRLSDAGITPVVTLTMAAKRLPDVPSANVVAELRGREKPEEIVLIGGHLDSWDVGQGAHDDGAGVVMSMQAVSLLKRLGLRPRRTIRAVLFANEECGLDGGRTYSQTHKAEATLHVVAMESDSGGFRPTGFSVFTTQPGLDTANNWLTLFAPIAALKITPAKGSPGADIGPMVALGVPGVGISIESTHYFDYHHTEADTLDKVVPADFKDSVAAYTLMAWLLAESPEPLPRPPKEDKGE
ncbi:MAG: M20/M25/M40 family metallo-hydrolase [Acidobacteriota bacterium]